MVATAVLGEVEVGWMTAMYGYLEGLPDGQRRNA
jgi:hypothetical protein